MRCLCTISVAYGFEWFAHKLIAHNFVFIYSFWNGIEYRTSTISHQHVIAVLVKKKKKKSYCKAHFSNLSMSEGSRPSQSMEETVSVGASNAIDWEQKVVIHWLL